MIHAIVFCLTPNCGEGLDVPVLCHA
eukprot:COSAG01_NODE_73614_length_240_cov_245.510638_1_plen_25_part_10